MSLEELNQQLHNPHSEEIEQRNKQLQSADPYAKPVQDSPFANGEHWKKEEKGLTPAQKKKLWILGVFGFIILLGIGWLIYLQATKKDAFHQDRVALFFEGPKEADSTQTVKYKIKYKNDNRVKLKNAQIVLTYTENFQPIDNVNLKFTSPTSSRIFIGDVGAREEGEVIVNGIFYAPKDFPVYLRASLQYTPSNIVKTLENKITNAVNITAAPVFLEMSAPKQVADGDAVEYLIDYKNLDIRAISDIQIRVTYPDGFVFGSADPVASEKDNAWYLGNVEPNQGGKIRIQGQMRGTKDESKVARISLGRYGKDGSFVVFNERERSSQMVVPALSIAQSVDGRGDVVSSGEVLTYLVKFINNSDIGLRDAIITAQVQGKAVDFSKLSVQKGAFDAARGIITWKASDVPELKNIAPKAGGEVRFTVPVKSVLPVESLSDKNFTITSVAKIDSPDIPTPLGQNKIIGSNNLVLKVKTKVFLETSAFYNDPRMENSGPIPLKVGSETLYALHWTISNISNDLKNVKVTSSLPSGIRWTGKIFPSSEKVEYNNRTNEITWSVGDVRAGVGVLEPKREVSFQIGITPQPNQVGQMPKLLNESNLSGADSFTSEALQLKIPSKDTQIPAVSTFNNRLLSIFY